MVNVMSLSALEDELDYADSCLKTKEGIEELHEGLFEFYLGAVGRIKEHYCALVNITGESLDRFLPDLGNKTQLNNPEESA